MAKLSTSDRKNLDKSQFAIPEKAPASGSYPIPDENHARDALSRASGKPEEGRVRAAVKRKFPNIGSSDNSNATSSSSNAKPSVKDRVSAAVKKAK